MAGSDIDVLVELDPAAHVSLFELASLERRLAELLGRKVDVVSKRGLQSGLDDSILADAVARVLAVRREDRLISRLRHIQQYGEGAKSAVRGQVARRGIISTMKTVPIPATEESDALVRPITLKLPAPLDDEAMLWLSANNETFGFERTAEGDLVVSPPTNSPGNRGEIRLLTQLTLWNDRTNFGEIRGISGGVALPKGGDREPDAFAVARATWDALPIADRKKGFVPVLPKALFELLSPKNVTTIGYTKEFQATLDDYARSAVPLVVLLDPRTDHATLKRPGKPDDVRTETILTFPELPGLALDVGIIYAACNNP